MLISDAAIEAGLEEMHLPCGAKGTCGQCLVEIVEGEADILTSTHLDKMLHTKKLALACQTKVRGDLTVRIPDTDDESIQVVGDSHFLVGKDHLPQPGQLTPLAHYVTVTVDSATIEEHYSDWQRFSKELSAVNNGRSVVCGVGVLQSLAEALRANNGVVTALVREEDTADRVLRVFAGGQAPVIYGLSIDIGTTTVAVQLVDLQDGRVLSSSTSYNAQIRRGVDVISRIDYARTPKHQAELRHLVLDTINEIVGQLVSDSGIVADSVMAAFLAGNTTMMHLLLGLSPRYIRETPYVPTVNSLHNLTASEIGLSINPEAAVGFAPGVGSYVGGDITSGLLCTDVPRRNDEVYLFLDIGTNGEIVLGNADWMIACACSAGPAFEGSGIKCGMRATRGAIEYVRIADDLEHVVTDVIGDTKPEGICGSGLISLLGEMFLMGVVDQSGRMSTEKASSRFTMVGSSPAFIVVRAGDSASGKDLVITEADVENLMRTKAAIYAACSLILSHVGLQWSAINKVIIAGGFGRYIQIPDAVLIGLLPDIGYDRFTYIGNSALTGAYIALLSRERREELASIAARMTYMDLSSDPHYMDRYLSALFLPHTDIKQFPSVEFRLWTA